MQQKLPKLPVKQYQFVIIPVVIVLIVVLATWLYIVPTINQINANKGIITKEKSELALLKTKYATLANSSEAGLEQQLDETRAALPETKNIPGLIGGLSRLAQESNVSIDTLQLKPGKIATESAGQELIVRMSVKGDLKNINAFLNKLGQIRRIFGVQKLSGTGNAVGNDFVTSLDVSFYTYPLPTNLGTSYADPLPELSTTKQNIIKQISQYPLYTETIGTVTEIIASPTATLAPVSTASASARPAVQGARTASPSARIR